MQRFKVRSMVEGCVGLGSKEDAPFLKDQMTLKSRSPIPIYYESLHGI